MTCYEIFYTWRMHRLKLTVYIHRAEVICHTFDFIIFLRESDEASSKFVYRQAQAQRSRFTFSKLWKLMYFWSWKKNSALTVGLKFYAVIGRLDSVGFSENLMPKVKYWRSIADYPQINRFDSEVCLDFKLPLVRKLSRTPNGTMNLNKWSSFVNDFFFLRYICTKNKLVFFLIANKKSLLSNASGKVTEGSAIFSREIVQSRPQGWNAFFLRYSQVVEITKSSLRQQWERLLRESTRSGKSLIQRRKYSACRKVHCLTKYKTNHYLL